MIKSIQKSGEKAEDCAVNLLPCRIYHDGPVNASSRYWCPTISDDGKREAYFRGRKLEGIEVKLPEGFSGVIVKDVDAEKIVPTSSKKETCLQGEESDDETEETRLLEPVGSFESVVIWGHDSIVDGDHAFVKGLGELIGFSRAINQPGEIAESKPK